jgi:hypothetical protein
MPPVRRIGHEGQNAPEQAAGHPGIPFPATLEGRVGLVHEDADGGEGGDGGARSRFASDWPTYWPSNLPGAKSTKLMPISAAMASLTAVLPVPGGPAEV